MINGSDKDEYLFAPAAGEEVSLLLREFGDHGKRHSFCVEKAGSHSHRQKPKVATSTNAEPEKPLLGQLLPVSHTVKAVLSTTSTRQHWTQWQLTGPI